MISRAVLATMTVTVALAVTACIPKTETVRVDAPPDTSVTFGEGPPTTGVFAGGGTFRLEGVEITAATCRVEAASDPIRELFKDPFDIQDTAEQVEIDQEKRADLVALLQEVEIRMGADGRTLVMTTTSDSSGSLPWSGQTRGGNTTRLDVSSLVLGAGDRVASLRIEVDGGEDAGNPDRTPAQGIGLDWREKAGSEPWLLDVAGGNGSCNADAGGEVVRAGPAPVPPAEPPTGPATITEAAGTVPAGIADLINRSHWVVGDDGAIGLELDNEQGIATGQVIESGAAWVVVLRGTNDAAAFDFRGAKVADGRVIGLLGAGGGRTPVTLSG